MKEDSLLDSYYIGKRKKDARDFLKWNERRIYLTTITTAGGQPIRKVEGN